MFCVLIRFVHTPIKQCLNGALTLFWIVLLKKRNRSTKPVLIPFEIKQINHCLKTFIFVPVCHYFVFKLLKKDFASMRKYFLLEIDSTELKIIISSQELQKKQCFLIVLHQIFIPSISRIKIKIKWQVKKRIMFNQDFNLDIVKLGVSEWLVAAVPIS
ncbi:hypothetical protein BpHYR1_037108 [Brachionus plicatilis]|uniref:Uncharacterized protein n=1 Tax=Brachionus plicatilis TaxID=10195 RepID=A0A3M7SSF3_BRAPC|nr:hypothetical protein BpHYR1_037108 [Brachionus plicatilis]